MISLENTIDSLHCHEGRTVTRSAESIKQPLQIIVTNNIGEAVNAYVTALDMSGKPVMLNANNQWLYPNYFGSNGIPQQIDPSSITIPLSREGLNTTFSLPGYCQSGRIWFAVGQLEFSTVGTESQPFTIVQPSEAATHGSNAAVSWGFIEFTYTQEGGLYANISYVDFVGLPLGMTLTETNGNSQQALGLPAHAVTNICDDLKIQAISDGLSWDQLCQTINGTIVRVLAPGAFVANNGSAFDDYYNDYVDKVYSSFTGSNPLIIDSQKSGVKSSCTGDGTSLTCQNDEIPFLKPTVSDIFGCNSGPFANTGSIAHKIHLARLCAAFNRGTFFVGGGNFQPGPSTDKYYTAAPANYYSAIVHKYEIDGKGYAFPYDDVNPHDEDVSGVVSSFTPQILAVTVGGPGNSLTRSRVRGF